MSDAAGVLNDIPGNMDFELPALRHHFTCGHGEVDENLFDLAAVGLHGGQARIDVDNQFDLFAQEAAQHFDDII